MTQKSSVLDYLKKKKWKYEEEGDKQYKIKTCPYCGTGSYKFYINKVTGQYHCFKCPATGNLYSLKKNLGDINKVEHIAQDSTSVSETQVKKALRKVRIYNKNLLSNRKIRQYIKKKWGYKLSTIREFQLGVQIKNNVKWLSIPYFVNGKVANIKFRALPPAEKTFKRLKGFDSSIYNVDQSDVSLDFVYLCEGESDTIALHSLGVQNVVGTSVGARGFKPEWIDFFDNFERIYIVYDPDVVGQEGAGKIAFRLGSHKCYNIVIPEGHKDLNEYILSGTSYEEVTELFDSAKLIDIEGVESVGSALGALEKQLSTSDTLDESHLRTPWENVNKLIGSFQPGDLIILSARPKIGKTTLALNILFEYAQVNIPCLLYCLEMRPERIATKLVSYHRLIGSRNINRDDVIVTNMKYGKKPLYFAYNYKFTPEVIYDTIREAVQRYGIEFVVFDHLHFLVRSASSVTAEISNAARNFKLLAEELKIPIILIAHPRKIAKKTSRMTFDDLKDSASIAADADTICILHRDRLPQDESGGDLFDTKTEIIIDASRYSSGGSTTLHFNGECSRYFLDEDEEAKSLMSRK